MDTEKYASVLPVSTVAAQSNLEAPKKRRIRGIRRTINNTDRGSVRYNIWFKEETKIELNSSLSSFFWDRAGKLAWAIDWPKRTTGAKTKVCAKSKTTRLLADRKDAKNTFAVIAICVTISVIERGTMR